MSDYTRPAGYLVNAETPADPAALPDSGQVSP